MTGAALMVRARITGCTMHSSMSPDVNGGRELTDVVAEAIAVRLDSIDDALKRIETDRLKEITEHLRTLNGRVGACEKWQAGADQMLDSINERVAMNFDRTDKSNERIEKCHERMDRCDEWVNQQKGWSSGRMQMIVQVSTLVGLLGAIITIFVKVH